MLLSNTQKPQDNLLFKPETPKKIGFVYYQMLQNCSQRNYEMESIGGNPKLIGVYNENIKLRNDDKIYLLFSEAIAEFNNPPKLKIGHFYPPIETSVKIHGHMAELTALQSIRYDKDAYMYLDFERSADVLFQNGEKLEFGYSSPYVDLYFRHLLEPKLTSASYWVFNEFINPTISAELSEPGLGTNVFASWKDNSNFGVTFSEPNALGTQIFVPTNIQENIEVEVTVNDDIGFQTTTWTPIKYFPPNGNLFAVSGEIEHKYTWGKLKDLVYTSLDTSISAQLNNKVLVHTNSESIPSNFISVSVSQPINGEEASSSNGYTLPFALPDITNIELNKTYSLSGDPAWWGSDRVRNAWDNFYLGCKAGFEEDVQFEILELETLDTLETDNDTTNIERLAIDFTHSCTDEEKTKSMTGVVRINSDVPF